MKTVYLAGLISTDFPESLQWRIDAQLSLVDAGFKVLSPMRGKSQLKSESQDGGISTTKNTSRDIVLRDFHDVQASDVILMHLESFGSPRPLLGTIVELGWAWYLRVPIVGIALEANYLMRNHPFVKEAVAHYCTSVEEAVDFTASYFGEKHHGL